MAGLCPIIHSLCPENNSCAWWVFDHRPNCSMCAISKIAIALRNIDFELGSEEDEF